MTDATQRGGALAAVYRSIKKRESGVVRLNRNDVVAEVEKIALAKGDGRNKPEAKVLGPSKPTPKV